MQALRSSQRTDLIAKAALTLVVVVECIVICKWYTINYQYFIAVILIPILIFLAYVLYRIYQLEMNKLALFDSAKPNNAAENKRDKKRVDEFL